LSDDFVRHERENAKEDRRTFRAFGAESNLTTETVNYGKNFMRFPRAWGPCEYVRVACP